MTMERRVQFAVLAAGVLVIFAATLSPVEAGAKKVVDACMQQTGATGADFQTFMKSGEASQTLKCMFSCALQAVKFMKADGTVDSSFIKTQMPPAVSGLVDTCTNKAQPEKDICQRAYVYLHCFVKAEPKIVVEFVSTD